MIKAVIFDCFGVLVTDGWLPFVDKYLASDDAKRRQAADLMAAVNRGMMDYRLFISEVAKLAEVDSSSAYEKIMRNAPNEKLFDYIAKELKPKYKIGLLSNTGRDRLNELFTTEQLALFNELVLSYETGYLKPQPEAYKLAADRLGVSADECVFIDDQEKRCAGAKEAGMKAIWFRDFEQMRHELEDVLAASKD